MKTKKIAALTLSAAMILTGLTACGESNPLRSSSTDKKIVMKVGDEKVKYEEYRYFYLNNKRDLYGEGAELTAEEENSIKQLVETNVVDRHTLRLMANDYGVKLTKDDEQRTNAYVETFRTTCGDDEAYKNQLKNQYLNEPFFKELTSDTTIAYALLDEMANQGGIAVSEADYEAAIKTDEVLCLKEIYITYPSAELKDWARERAEEVMAKLKAGGNFEELMAEYSNYNGDDLPPEHGYYTMEYDALEEIWDTAKDLKEGEYSDIVETAFGYHIVKRSAKDNDYIGTIHDELYEIFRQSRFYKKFYEYRSTVGVEYTEFGEGLNDGNIT